MIQTKNQLFRVGITEGNVGQVLWSKNTSEICQGTHGTFYSKACTTRKLDIRAVSSSPVFNYASFSCAKNDIILALAFSFLSYNTIDKHNNIINNIEVEILVEATLP